jgi:putative hydrolase of the HAD superfamily
LVCSVTDRTVEAVLLDAGGVLVFPRPEAMLPPLRAAGVSPDAATLERAHYRAMSLLDVPGTADPGRDTWWRSYLVDYVTECGVAPERGGALADEMAMGIKDFGWTHVGPGVGGGLRELAALGIPLGVVSNSDGTVEGELRRLGVCQTGDGDGVRVGVVVDSAVAGVAKPDPAIFRIALDALGIEASTRVLHVGDSLRYDVAGALVAGLRPVHLDPYGYCPAPADHDHVTSLSEVSRVAAR